MIEFVDVSKRYRSQRVYALDHVTFRVEDGEFLFLTGQSGSGKTTLIRLLAKEETLTTGRIVANDFDLTMLPPKKLPYYRRTLGIVFQNYRLIQTKTVWDNLAFAMHAVGARPRIIRNRIKDVLRLVGLEGKEKRFPAELAGGEQQRVAIARALVNRPRALLADEPTGNLDPERAFVIMELFEKINLELGTTILVVSHAKELVNQMGKRVISLEHGRIISDSHHAHYHLEGS